MKVIDASEPLPFSGCLKLGLGKVERIIFVCKEDKNFQDYFKGWVALVRVWTGGSLAGLALIDFMYKG